MEKDTLWINLGKRKKKSLHLWRLSDFLSSICLLFQVTVSAFDKRSIFLLERWLFNVTKGCEPSSFSINTYWVSKWTDCLIISLNELRRASQINLLGARLHRPNHTEGKAGRGELYWALDTQWAPIEKSLLHCSPGCYLGLSEIRVP